MISKAKKGQSFKGAALYFLHDKNSLTSERVDFTHTGNLATNDPEMAAKMMAYTAMHQDQIKRAAGGVLKGRKTTHPVYAYSISWHPSQEPTQEQMIKAGYESLKAVKLEDHEFIMVSHNDEPHKHLHIIVNRIHPETGIAAKLSHDYHHLSRWAEEYERSHGKIFCKQRVENNKKRRNGKYVKDRQSLNKAEFYRWQREKIRQAFIQRQKEERNLSKIHKKQREELFKARENQLEKTRLKLKEAHRPKWAMIYTQQKGERLVLQDAQRSAMQRLVYYIKNRNQNRPTGSLTIKRGLLSGAYNAITNGNDLSKGLEEKHVQQRKAFVRIVEKNNRSTIEKVNRHYHNKFSQLQNIQRGERRIQKTRHIEESKKLASDLTSGKTQKEFEREKKNAAFRKMAKDLTHKKTREDLNHKKDIKGHKLKNEFNTSSDRKEKILEDNKLKKEFDHAGERTEKDIKQEQLRKDLSSAAGKKGEENKDQALKKNFDSALDRTQEDIKRDQMKEDFGITDNGQEKDINRGKLSKDFNIASGKTQEIENGGKKKDEDMRQLRADLVKNTGLDEIKEPDKSKEIEQRRPLPKPPGRSR